MPGWQQLYQAHRKDHFEILSVAIDSQGANGARRWHEKAGAAFTTVVDQDDTLGAKLGFKVIPNGLLLDAGGVLRFAQFGGFNVANTETADRVKAFIANPAGLDAASISTPVAPTASDWEKHFRRGVTLAEQNRVSEAVAEFRQALLRDPDNWIIRKQLWRLLHPDKFGEQIDLGWQAEQRKREAELGLERANSPGEK